MKILLAIDESNCSEAAIDTLIEQAPPKGTEVRVLHAVESPPLLLSREMGGYEPNLEEMQQRQLEEAEALVQRTAARLRECGYTVSADVEQGDPRARIVDVAREWGADLILLGCHGRKGLERFLMGSVSEGVARHAHCTVQIVREAVAS